VGERFIMAAISTKPSRQTTQHPHKVRKQSTGKGKKKSTTESAQKTRRRRRLPYHLLLPTANHSRCITRRVRELCVCVCFPSCFLKRSSYWGLFFFFLRTLFHFFLLFIRLLNFTAPSSSSSTRDRKTAAPRRRAAPAAHSGRSPANRTHHSASAP
jgi:hypothetical protein